MLERIMRLCKINQGFATSEDGYSMALVTLTCLHANYIFSCLMYVNLSVVHIWFIKIINSDGKCMGQML